MPPDYAGCSDRESCSVQGSRAIPDLVRLGNSSVLNRECATGTWPRL
jgi:hypothetical protein